MGQKSLQVGKMVLSRFGMQQPDNRYEFSGKVGLALYHL